MLRCQINRFIAFLYTAFWLGKNWKSPILVLFARGSRVKLCFYHFLLQTLLLNETGTF